MARLNRPSASTLPQPFRPNRGADGHAKGASVALFGEWGFGNLGDQAILEGAQRFVQLTGSDVAPFVLGSLLPYEAQHQRSGVDGVQRSRKAAAHARRLARTPLRPLRNRIRSRALNPILEECRAIVIGGGALLDDTRNHFTDSLLRVARLSRVLDKPLLCLGCGSVGPWSDRGKRQLGAFGRSCAYIAVRDAGTAAQLSEVLGRNVDLFGDFAMSVPGSGPSRLARQHANTSLALNVAGARGLGRPEQVLLEARLVEIARAWAAGANGRRVTVFTTGVPGDNAAALRLVRQIEDLSPAVLMPTQLVALERVIKQSDVLVAVRLHAAILSLELGTPFVGVATGPKLSNFFGTIGLERCLVSATSEDAVGRVIALLDREAIAPSEGLNLLPLLRARSEATRQLRLIANPEPR